MLKFSGNRLAVCTCSISMKLVSDAVIVGTKGTIKVRGEKTYSVPHNKTSVMIKEQFCNKKSRVGYFHSSCPTTCGAPPNWK